VLPGPALGPAFGPALGPALGPGFGGVARTADVVDAGGGLIRVVPTDDAVAEREPHTVRRSMDIVRARLKEVGVEATVEATGTRRIAIRLWDQGDPLRLRTP